MRLLIVTQTVDRTDPTLGFFHQWIEEFAKRCERVFAVCLREGVHELPRNVRVLSLGKESRPQNALGILRARARYLSRFFRYIWTYRRQYDAVFVHMNHTYVLLGGLLWRALGTRVCLWYAHGAVPFTLRLAEKFAHIVVSSTPEGFQLPSKKLHTVGQGIDTDFFTPDPSVSRGVALLSVGRLSQSKRHDLAIRAAALAGRELRIAGEGPEYKALEALARSLGAAVVFLGGLSREHLREEYRTAAVLVHTSETGSLDKVVLEALSCGTPVVTTSCALFGVPAVVVPATVEALAEAVREPPLPDVQYAAYVRRVHTLSSLIPRILAACAPGVERVADAEKTVLVATGLYPPDIGGPATYAAMLEKELPKYGWHVDVLPFREVRHLPKVVRHFVYFLKCVARARQSRARALFALDPVSVGLPAMLAARLLRKDFFLRLGGDYAWEQGRLRFGVTAELEECACGVGRHYSMMVWFLRSIQSFVARRALRVSVQSEQMKRVVGCWDVPEEKIMVIPNGFDAPRDIFDKESARRELGITGMSIVSAGRFVPWKGFVGIIEAMPEILKTMPDLVLYIIGDGPEEQRLKDMVHTKGLTMQIVFTGRLARDTLMQYLAAADVFVLNSQYEGFSHQILEAYAAGAPVIATDIPGNEGVVEHGINGLLVPRRDTAALVDAVIKVCTDTALGERLVSGGRRKLEEYDAKRAVGATAAFLS